MDHRGRGHRGTRRATATGRRGCWPRSAWPRAVAAGRRRPPPPGPPPGRWRGRSRPRSDGPTPASTASPARPPPSARRSTARATPISGTGRAGPRRRRPRRGGSLNSVSCTSPTFCVALNGQLAVVFNGTTWTTTAAVGPAPAAHGWPVPGVVHVAHLLRLGQHRRRGVHASTAPRGATTPWSTTAPPTSRSRTSRAPRPPSAWWSRPPATSPPSTARRGAGSPRPASRCSTRCRAPRRSSAWPST